MKTNLLKVFTFVCSMAALCACSNDEVETVVQDEFPDLSEMVLAKDIATKVWDLGGSFEVWEIDDFEKVTSEAVYQKWHDDDYRSILTCYHSLEKVDEQFKELIPEIDWETQTLVIAVVNGRNVIEVDDCSIYCSEGKYYFDISVLGTLLTALDCKIITFVLNEKDVPLKNLKLNVKDVTDEYLREKEAKE